MHTYKTTNYKWVFVKNRSCSPISGKEDSGPGDMEKAGTFQLLILALF